MTPDVELYAMPAPPESDVEEILLLNVLKSIDERYPLAPVPDCEMVKAPVEELQLRGVTAWIDVDERRPSDEVAMVPTLPLVLKSKPLSEPIETLERVVAPAVRVPSVAPPSALNRPLIVVEPMIANAVPVAFTKSRSAKCEVEEAKRPDCAQNGEEVAAATTL